MINKKIIILVLVFIVIFALTLFFYINRTIALGDGYYLKTGKIYYNQKLITNNCENFELIDNGFAKNNSFFFYYGEGFSANMDYFNFVSDKYCVTSNAIYSFNPKTGIKRIRNVDGKSFEFVKNNYAKDNKLYYYINADNQSGFTCVKLELIDDDDEYDAKCGYSFYKQGQFVEHTEQYQNSINNQKLNKKWKEENQPKLNSNLIEELFGKDSVRSLMYFPNIVCKKKRNDALEDVTTYSFYYGLKINNQNFSSNYECLKYNKNCNKTKEEKNAISRELDNNKFNIINGCLYNNEDRAFEYNLLIKKHLGHFGEQYKIINKKNIGVKYFWDSANEWFRFEHKNKLYIFLKGFAGCGGCVFNGHYLVVNLSTDTISTASADLPYLPNLFLSPDKKGAIEVSFSRDNHKYKDIRLYYYDFISRQKLYEVYKITEGKTILVSGDGVYPLKESILWLDNHTIKVQQYEQSEKNFEEAIQLHEQKNGVSVYAGYKKLGEPLSFKIKR